MTETIVILVLVGLVMVGGKTAVKSTVHGGESVVHVVSKTPHVVKKTVKIASKPLVFAGKRIATK